MFTAKLRGGPGQVWCRAQCVTPRTSSRVGLISAPIDFACTTPAKSPCQRPQIGDPTLHVTCQLREYPGPKIPKFQPESSGVEDKVNCGCDVPPNTAAVTSGLDVPQLHSN